MAAVDEKQIPAKVEAMFSAVMDMLEEGADIATIKVSQITAKAGIGKGTAYEYFSSKEELIIKAVCYENNKRYQKLRAGIFAESTFRGKLFAIMEWTQDNYEMHRILERLLKSKITPACLSEEIKQRACSKDGLGEITELIDHIIEAGIGEHKVHQENRFLCRITLVSQLVQFVMFKQSDEANKGITETEMKEYVYRSLEKLLG